MIYYTIIINLGLRFSSGQLPSKFCTGILYLFLASPVRVQIMKLVFILAKCPKKENNS
jgi:hypothetical protein